MLVKWATDGHIIPTRGFPQIHIICLILSKFCTYTTVILVCSAQNFKTNGHLKIRYEPRFPNIWIYSTCTFVCIRWISDGCPVLKQPDEPLRHFYQHGLTLIPTCKNNHIHYKVWDDITYPFPNLKCCAVEVQEWMNYFIPHFIMVWLLIHAGIKVNPF